MKKQKWQRNITAAMGLCLILMGLLLYVHRKFQTGYFGVLPEDILIQIPFEDLPEDTLYITGERREYQRGEMTLIIPSIDVYAFVGESTEPEGLEQMPGLYEFSQMPGEGNVNVSIAGHRDIHDMVFYDMHLVGEGDFLYLLYGGMVFRYTYDSGEVVDPYDWSVITPQGFSSLTLTTCDPIGTTLRRLVVRARLDRIQPFDENYTFHRNIQDIPVG